MSTLFFGLRSILLMRRKESWRWQPWSRVCIRQGPAPSARSLSWTGSYFVPDVGGSCVVFAGLVGSSWSSIGRFVPIACMTVVGRLKIMRLVPALKSGKGQRTDLAALGVVAGIASVGFFCSVHPWLSNRVA